MTTALDNAYPRKTIHNLTPPLGKINWTHVYQWLNRAHFKQTDDTARPSWLSLSARRYQTPRRMDTAIDIRIDGYWTRDWPIIKNHSLDAMPNDPLRARIVRGELAMGLCGLLSTVSTLALFLWITYKLWRRKPVKKPQQPPEAGEDIWGVTPPPGPPGRPIIRAAVVRSRDSGMAVAGARRVRRPAHVYEMDPEPNSFLILIYNLLLGDINQSMAFCFSLVWFKQGDVKDGAACWAQGWFINTGRLSTAVFFALISLYTFVVLVLGRTPGKVPLYITITCLWAFTYGMTALGIILTRNGKDSGGWYIPLSIWVRLSPASSPLIKHVEAREKLTRAHSAGSTTNTAVCGSGWSTSGSSCRFV